MLTWYFVSSLSISRKIIHFYIGGNSLCTKIFWMLTKNGKPKVLFLFAKGGNYTCYNAFPLSQYASLIPSEEFPEARYPAVLMNSQITQTLRNRNKRVLCIS